MAEHGKLGEAWGQNSGQPFRMGYINREHFKKERGRKGREALGTNPYIGLVSLW